MAIQELVNIRIVVTNADSAARELRNLANVVATLAESEFQRMATGATSASAALGTVGAAAEEMASRVSAGAIELNEANFNKLRAQVQDLSKALQDLQNQQGKSARATRQHGQQIDHSNVAATRFNLLAIDSSRALQDSVFGIRAVINNLDPLILNWRRYREALKDAEEAGEEVGSVFTQMRQNMAGTVLTLIAVSFAIGELTGINDELSKGIGESLKALIGIDERGKAYKKTLEEVAKESVRLKDELAFTDLTGLRELALDAQELETRLVQLSLAKGLFPTQEAAEQATRAIVEEYDEAVQTFIDLGDAAEAGVEKAEAELAKLEVAFNNFVAGISTITTDPIEDLFDRLADAELDSAKQTARLTRTQTDDQKAAVEERIRDAERAADAQIAQYQRELESYAAQQQELIDSPDFTEERLERSQAVILAAAENLANARRERDRIRDVETAEFDREQEDKRRDFTRIIEDIEAASARRRLSVLEDSVDKRLSLLDLETEAVRRALQRQGEDLSERFDADPAVLAAITDAIDQLSSIEGAQRQDILDEEFEAEAAHVESIARLREDSLLSVGAAEERVLQDRLARLDAFLLRAEGDAERQRAILLEIEGIELAIELARINRANSEGDRRRKEIDDLETFERRRDKLLRDIERAGAPDAGLLSTLRAQEEALRQEVEAANAALVDLDALRDTVEAIRFDLETFPENTALAAALRVAEEAVKDGEEALDDFRRAQLDLLQVQKQVAAEERAIWDSRIDAVADFGKELGDAITEAVFSQRDLLDEEISITKERFRLEEIELEESLRRRRLSYDEFNLRVRELALERSEFEQRVEEETAGVAARIWAELGSLRRELTREIISQIISIAAKQIATTILTTKVTEKVVGDSMQKILANAAPAAAATSVASFGASAIAGSVAALAAIAAIYTALKGFEEGGWTGRKGKSDPAGVVHGREFVFTSTAVKDTPGPFYALMSALQKGLAPEAIYGWLRMEGWPTTGTGLQRVTGMYQSGGFVEAARSLPAPSGGGNDTTREIRALRGDVQSLKQAIRDLRFNVELQTPERVLRSIVDTGNDVRRQVDPRG